MAEQLVSTVLEKLSYGMEKLPVAEEVFNTLVVLKEVIPSAEEKQIENDQVMVLLEELKAAVYSVDDVLEDWNARLHSKVRHSYLLSPFISLRSLLVHRDIGHRLKVLNQRLNQIASRIDKLPPLLGQFPPVTITRPFPLGYESMSVGGGGGDVKRAMLQDLLSDIDSSDIHVPVICITGMGGIGKTTLAAQIINDEEIARHFEQRIWVFVADTFDIRSVCEDIIRAVTRDAPTGLGLEDTLKCLSDSLRGKLFLLVLDDVWSDDPNFWNPLKGALASGATGSRVLVTTRDKDLAAKLSSTAPHEVKVFSPDEAWILFSEIAFEGWGEERKEFQRIGKEILASCLGNPLAIKIIARLLNLKQTLHDWESVLGTLGGSVLETENQTSRVLFLNYKALSSNIRQCLLYCAIFPNNMEIHRDDIIKLWMAQGYLGSDGTKQLEAIGGDYFDSLCLASFLQTLEMGSDGKILSCKMHNTVLDFVRWLTKGECYSLTKTRNEHSISKIVRHLTTINMENPAIYSNKHLLTLIRPFDFRRSTFTVPIKLFRQLAHLRALDLSFSSFEELPSKVGELLHLRYLDLSHTSLLKLPETITNLRHLQTLKLNNCRILSELPEGIGKLVELRHLEIKRTEDLRYLPWGIAKLVFLRTLNKFVVGGASQGCSIEGLKHLKHIEGKLKIIGLGKVAEMREAAEAEVKNKQCLNSLILNFGYLTDGDVKKSELILQNLQPHENLKELKIKFFPGSEFPFWIGSKSALINLETLVLSKCENCKELPALDNLQSLRNLALVEMNSVNNIGLEFYGCGITSGSTAKMVAFSNLQILTFCGLLDWEEWKIPVSAQRNIMPNLRVITIKDCPKLNSLPALGRLESLEDLVICNLKSLISIGNEFYGVGDASSSEVTAFSKLKKLEITSMKMLDNWEIPFSPCRNIMPSLSELTLSDCPKLRSFPGFGKLESLKSLSINNLLSVERIGLEFLGIAGEELVQRVDIFPKLMKLVITDMPMLVDWDMSLEPGTAIMPKLRHLKIENCRKLKSVPYLGGPRTLDSLRLIIG